MWGFVVSDWFGNEDDTSNGRESENLFIDKVLARKFLLEADSEVKSLSKFEGTICAMEPAEWVASLQKKDKDC